MLSPLAERSLPRQNASPAGLLVLFKGRRHPQMAQIANLAGLQSNNGKWYSLPTFLRNLAGIAFTLRTAGHGKQIILGHTIPASTSSTQTTALKDMVKMVKQFLRYWCIRFENRKNHQLPRGLKVTTPYNTSPIVCLCFWKTAQG